MENCEIRQLLQVLGSAFAIYVKNFYLKEYFSQVLDNSFNEEVEVLKNYFSSISNIHIHLYEKFFFKIQT